MSRDESGDDPGALVPTIRSPGHGRQGYALHPPLLTVREDGADRVRRFARFWRTVRVFGGLRMVEQADLGGEWLVPPGAPLGREKGARP